MTRSLSRGVDRSAPTLGTGAPRGHGRQAVDERERLGEFLESQLPRLPGFTHEQNEKRVAEALETMTLAERVFAEVEMQSRLQVMHSYDYDPLRYGR